MHEHLRDMPLDFSKWQLYGTVHEFKINDTPIPGLRQDCYQIEINGEMISAGVFEYNGKRTHVAWGKKSDTHCSFHALIDGRGNLGEVAVGCPEYTLLKQRGAISGFRVDTTAFRL